MSNPFGTSNQGGYQGPPTSTQAAPQQGFGGGAGYGGYGGFGGFQSQPSYGGFGGGFGGFNPMFGGLGGLGFNPMMGMGFMQPMPFFGGFGGGYGGFGGFGGGFSPYQQPQFNPMFGGLGGLGFNPMMGGQFMQPMQRFDPYQQFQQPQDFGSLDMRYRGGPQMSPEMRQRREQDMRALETQANASLTPDAETQYQQEQTAAQQQRAMNPGGRSMQDWQAQYSQRYNPNRMTMDMAPSLDEFIQRRTNPISFPGMPGFTL